MIRHCPGIVLSMDHLSLVAILVDDYDRAIEFFVDVLRFELVEDSPSLTNDGRPKRWVVVRPSGTPSGFLIAKADGPTQEALVGDQFGGRVGFFLHVDDFEETVSRLAEADIKFVGEPRVEPYGKVVVFHDVFGNKWDLLGPLSA